MDFKMRGPSRGTKVKETNEVFQICDVLEKDGDELN